MHAISHTMFVRSAVRMSGIMLLTFLLHGCSTLPKSALIETQTLLSGQILFNKNIDVVDIRSEHILITNDAMKRYVHSRVGDVATAKSRLKLLIQAMIDDGLLTLDYDANLTYTASETFHSRQGNCLSFSNLFVALAREADLDVQFQTVAIPPSFSSDGKLILLNNHINVLVKQVRRDNAQLQDYVVDFNTAEYSGNFATKRVDDNYAKALYFSNLAVEQMQLEQWENAFRYLKKGIQSDDSIAGLWVNLGALYSQHHLYQAAISAYRNALTLQKSNKSALINLAVAHQTLGDTQAADYYYKRANYYREHNPYYHYSLAKLALGDQNPNLAIENVKRAINLKDDEHLFFHLQSMAYEKLGNREASRKSLQRAKKLSVKDWQVLGYERKLQAF